MRLPQTLVIAALGHVAHFFLTEQFVEHNPRW